MIVSRASRGWYGLLRRRCASLAAVTVQDASVNSHAAGDGVSQGVRARIDVAPAREFMSLGLSSPVSSALASINVSSPTSIQKAAIPRILSGKNTIIAAETGSGKTLAYLAPLVSLLKATDPPFELRRPKRPRAIVLVPTRELVMQVVQVARSLTHVCRFSVREALGGGGSTALRRKSLRKALETSPVDVLVATPGMLQLMREEKLVILSELECVVIDEVDVTLAAQGFEAQVKPFLDAVDAKTKIEPPQKPAQFVYAGASMPGSVRWRIRKRHSKGDVITSTENARNVDHGRFEGKEEDVDISVAETQSFHVATPPKNVKTKFIRVAGGEKAKLDRTVEAVADLIRSHKDDKIIVFCDRGFRRDELKGKLERAIPDTVDVVHMSSRSNSDRFDRWQDWVRFQKDEDCRVAICAQSFSRGIDLQNIRHVVMTDVPMTGNEYLHRVGRIRAPTPDESASITVMVSGRDRAIAEALFLAHVRGDKLSDLNAPSAWRSYMDACRDRIASDSKTVAARRSGHAFWVDERSRLNEGSGESKRGPVRRAFSRRSSPARSQGAFSHRGDGRTSRRGDDGESRGSYSDGEQDSRSGRASHRGGFQPQYGGRGTSRDDKYQRDEKYQRDGSGRGRRSDSRDFSGRDGNGDRRDLAGRSERRRHSSDSRPRDDFRQRDDRKPSARRRQSDDGHDYSPRRGAGESRGRPWDRQPRARTSRDDGASTRGIDMNRRDSRRAHRYEARRRSDAGPFAGA